MTERPLPQGKQKSPHANAVFLLRHALYLRKQIQQARNKARYSVEKSVMNTA